MAVFGPWIRKIQIYFAYFSFSENLQDIFSLHSDKFYIRKRIFFHFLNSTQKNTGIFFDSHIINIRMQAGQLHKEPSLSHSDFDMDWVIISKNLCPFPCHFCFIMYDIITAANHFSGTCNISQSQFDLLF